MSYYPEPENQIQIRNKVKLELDLLKSNYATKKDFTALKAKVGKLDINKFVNVPVSLHNLSRWFRYW